MAGDAAVILVVRHAVAGEKSTWKGRPDAERPLSGRGRRQARALAKQLRDLPVDRIISSPYARCTETMGPLAEARGVEVELDDRLAPDTDFDALRGLLESLVDEDVAVCSHGEVIGELVRRFEELGVRAPRQRQWRKGSTWVLRTKGGRLHKASYREPRR